MLIQPWARAIQNALWNITKWRHNERHGVSNHRYLDCLLNRLLKRISKTHQSSASLAFVSGFRSQRASDGENVSLWWRHHIHGVVSWRGVVPLKKASYAELWCFLWSAPEQTVEQTICHILLWFGIGQQTRQHQRSNALRCQRIKRISFVQLQSPSNRIIKEILQCKYDSFWLKFDRGVANSVRWLRWWLGAKKSLPELMMTQFTSHQQLN